MKKAKLPIEHWQELIDHIDSTWRKKKGVDFGYPFQGRDFKDLRHFAKVFKPWGLMALWNCFIETNSEWVMRSGYSVSSFLACLPWLVDVPGWKKTADSYEKKLVGDMPPSIKEVLDKTISI